MSEHSPKPDFSAQLKEAPHFIARTHPKLKEWTGYSGRTWANKDSLKQTTGIKRIMLGNSVAYEKKSLISWLEERSRLL
jgi:hypothetical protein